MERAGILLLILCGFVALACAQPYLPCGLSSCGKLSTSCPVQNSELYSASVSIQPQSFNVQNPLNFDCTYTLGKSLTLKSSCFDEPSRNVFISQNNLTFPFQLTSNSTTLACKQYVGSTLYGFFQNQYFSFSEQFQTALSYLFPGCPASYQTTCYANNLNTPCEATIQQETSYNYYPSPCPSGNNQLLISNFGMSSLRVNFLNNGNPVFNISNIFGTDCSALHCVPGDVTEITLTYGTQTYNSTKVNWTGSTIASLYITSQNTLIVGNIAQNLAPNITMIRFVNPYTSTISAYSLVINGVTLFNSAEPGISKYTAFDCSTQPCLISVNGAAPVSQYLRPYSSYAIIGQIYNTCYESVMSYTSVASFTVDTFIAPNSTVKEGSPRLGTTGVVYAGMCGRPFV